MRSEVRDTPLQVRTIWLDNKTLFLQSHGIDQVVINKNDDNTEETKCTGCVQKGIEICKDNTDIKEEFTVVEDKIDEPKIFEDEVTKEQR